CFFFQAEDGIRAFHVTGVQTCALPISAFSRWPVARCSPATTTATIRRRLPTTPQACRCAPSGPRRSAAARGTDLCRPWSATRYRSEERRVGKEGSAGGWARRVADRDGQ